MPRNYELGDLPERYRRQVLDNPPRLPVNLPRRAEASEASFSSYLRPLFKAYGWLVYHTPDAKRSGGDSRDPGYPDLTLYHPKGAAARERSGRIIFSPVLIFAELKTRAGRLKPEQKTWAEAVELLSIETDGVVLYRLWRPADWPEIRVIIDRTL